MLDLIDAYVAREHWPAILTAAVLQAGFLLVVFTLLGVPLPGALALIHLLTSIGGIFLAIYALSLDAAKERLRALDLARRAVSSLIVSALSLVLMILFARIGYAGA